MEEPHLPLPVRSALGTLCAAGIPTYLVGGAVRDGLLGRAVRDWDAVVCASLERAKEVLPAAIQVQAQTPVLLLPGPPRLELTALRYGVGTLTEDLMRRDFTINALAWDACAPSWIDPWGGRADLEARRLRACAPERGFRDDPARILRGIRLATDVGLWIEPATRRAMERDHWRVALLAGERKRDELFRLLELPTPLVALEELRRSGTLAALLPELLRGVGVEQNRMHPDYVYRHALTVCALLPPEPLLRLAGLLHDVAKPETKGFAGRAGDVSFHRHELRARGHLKRIAGRLRLSSREGQTLERLVRHHLLFEERLQTRAAIQRMLRRVGRDILDDLLALRRADLASRGSVPRSWEECEGRIREEAASAPPVALAINGEDVMRELGIGPGRDVGRWLARARRRVNRDPSQNRRGRLLAWLRRGAAKA